MLKWIVIAIPCVIIGLVVTSMIIGDDYDKWQNDDWR